MYRNKKTRNILTWTSFYTLFYSCFIFLQKKFPMAENSTLRYECDETFSDECELAARAAGEWCNHTCQENVCSHEYRTKFYITRCDIKFFKKDRASPVTPEGKNRRSYVVPGARRPPNASESHLTPEERALQVIPWQVL